MNARRTVGVVVIPAMLALGIAVAAATLARRVPDPMATHFSPVRADGATSVAAFTWGCVLATLIAAAGTTLAGWRLRNRWALRSTVAGTTFLAATAAAVFVSTCLVQLDLNDWRDARMPVVWVVAIIGAPCALAGVAGWAASAGVAPAEAPPRHETPHMTLGHAQTAVWTSRLHVRSMTLMGATAIPVAVAVFWLVPGVWFLIPLVVGVAGLMLSTIRVTVDARGLAVAYGPLAWPTTRIPIARMVSVRAEEIRPSEWGGWGYRGSLRMFGKAAVVLRSGPGIVVDLTDGARFAVTVDDADTGASLLDAHVARRAEN